MNRQNSPLAINTQQAAPREHSTEEQHLSESLSELSLSDESDELESLLLLLLLLLSLSLSLSELLLLSEPWACTAASAACCWAAMILGISFKCSRMLSVRPPRPMLVKKLMLKRMLRTESCAVQGGILSCGHVRGNIHATTLSH